MDKFAEQIQCEEVYQEVIQVNFDEVLYLTPNKVIHGFIVDGKLYSAAGFNAKVEQVEMNHVKITKNGQEFFFELNNQTKWLEDRE